MRIGLLAGAVGLAVGLPALASDLRKTEFRVLNPDGTPVTPEFPFGDTRHNAPHISLDMTSAFASVGRGGSMTDGALATLDTGYESVNVLPAELVNQNDTPTWGGSAASVTGRSRFSGVTAGLAIPKYGVVTETVGGNSTKKIRGFADVGFGVNQFFGSWCNYNYVKTNTSTGAIASRYVFRPDTGQDVRQLHEAFITAITSLWTTEPVYVSSGFIVGRLLWGGENATTGIGLPVGPIPDFYTLGLDPNAFNTGIFVPCLSPANYRPMPLGDGSAFPGGAGQLVPVPVGIWIKLIHEMDTSGNLTHVVNNLSNTHGEYQIYKDLGIQVGRVDRAAHSGGFEQTNDAYYDDNHHVEGVEFVLPVPPALECAGGAFVDDENWLFPGPLTGQSTQWFDARSARANVVAANAAPANFTTQSISRVNFFADDEYRSENRRTLPLTFASGAGPWRVCDTLYIPSSGGAPNATVQVVSPASVTDGDWATRLFIGRFDPNNPPYLSRMYVQTNVDYAPIDDEDTADPYAPGPNGNGGVPVIGTDVADTGVNWTFNSQRTVCFDVTQTNGLTIAINAVNLYTGTSFVNSIDRLDFECENQSIGANNIVYFNDVTLTCAVLPLVTYPPLTLVYNDDLEWGLLDVTIGVQDDDGVATTPTRWSSAANMPVKQGAGTNATKVLRMENLFRDTPASAPNIPPNAGPPPTGFFQFTQASTQVPTINGTAARSWVARSDNMMTDGATSRIWTATQSTISATLFNRISSIVYSSVTGTLWVERPLVPLPAVAPFSTFIDSGTTLASMGVPFGQWFNLSINRGRMTDTLDPNPPVNIITYRVNGKLVQFGSGPNLGQVVYGQQLRSLNNGTHQNLDRMFYLSADEDSAALGQSILYTDNVKVWALPCLGDTNNDGLVNFTDLNNVLGFFGTSNATLNGVNMTGNVAPDADGDGVPDDEDPSAAILHRVNFTDLNAVLSGFGIPCV